MMVIMALRVLARHRLRAGLTMLGVIIGVGSVIAIVSIGQGAVVSIQDRIASLGSNVIVIHRGYSSVKGLRKVRATITVADAEALLLRVPLLTAVSYSKGGNVQVVHEGNNWSTSVSGVTPAYFQVREWPLVKGTVFTRKDVDSAAKVAILGQTVVKELFDIGVNPLGANLRINKIPFTVIGVLAQKGTSVWGNDQDDKIVIPFTTAERKVLGTKQAQTVSWIFASTARAEDMPKAVESIAQVLRERHRLADDEDDDFYVRTQLDLGQTRQETADAMMTLLFVMASISLLVGGIGIMNTLLVSVTERTREIGIRLAVGAKRRQIMFQFLVESVVLSLVGGLIGVGVGVAAAKITTAYAGWPTVISPSFLLLAFAFSATVGVVFGLYPAHKASRMNPIDALRYE